MNFEATPEDSQLIEDIATRALRSLIGDKYGDNRGEIEMDITATHLNGCPLKLQELLDASMFDFTHDILGIRRHLNRRTGKLENCFLPRYAKEQ